MAGLVQTAQAQYPERGVTLIVPYGAGGGTDVTARLLAKDLEAAMGKSVTVENRAGGGGWVGWGAFISGAPRRLHVGVPQRAEHVRRLSRPQGWPQGEPGQLHAADEPRARLQHLGRQGGQPLQGREGRHRGSGAERPSRSRLPPTGPAATIISLSCRSRPRRTSGLPSFTIAAPPRPRPRCSARTCKCWAPTSARSPRR